MDSQPIRILFVCLGNICRSPLAEGMFRHQVAEAGLSERFDIDSAGTSGYHESEPPDARATEVARRRGITLQGRSRQFTAEDADSFDYLIAMDRENLDGVRRMAGGSGSDARVHLLREFDPEAEEEEPEVPDPYFGGARGFEDVHDLVERSCKGLLRHIREENGL